MSEKERNDEATITITGINAKKFEEVIDKASTLLKKADYPAKVRLDRSEVPLNDHSLLWKAIRYTTEQIAFDKYKDHVHKNFAKVKHQFGTEAYENLRKVTDDFLVQYAGIMENKKKSDKKQSTSVLTMAEKNKLEDALHEHQYVLERSDLTKEEKDKLQKLEEKYKGHLPYLDNVSGALDDVDSPQGNGEEHIQEIRVKRFHHPSMIELIWSYWMEEGMVAQSINAIALRFQNRRSGGRVDHLSSLEIGCLRPINNFLWGYIQDEYRRLPLLRRAYEYDHHYGLALYGRAVRGLRPADSRSTFLEAFHNLLFSTSRFYEQDADATIIAEGFPLLNSLRELHLILAEGAHNQYGDLPWTARREMLLEQFLLARPEMRTFLKSRDMMTYPEEWMGQVDAMKKMQGWNDTGIIHFHSLAQCGEQVLLSVRFGGWIKIEDADYAKDWARFWKPEIQRYIHAYRAVTGVDLTTEPVDATMPSVHLRNRERERQGRAA